MTSQWVNSSAEYKPLAAKLGWDKYITFEDMILEVTLYNIERLPPDFYADNPTDFYGGDYIDYKVKSVYVPNTTEWAKVVTPDTIDVFAETYREEIEECIINALIQEAEEYIPPYVDGEPFYH